MRVDPTYVPVEQSGDATDPFMRRMVGVARHGNIPFDVPYMSHITEDLFVGGCTTGLVLPPYIKHVVSLYPWESYTVHHTPASYVEIEMYDSHDQEMQQIKEIGAWLINRVQEGPTLVHCQAGLNRSNLLAAYALIQGAGYTADDAIALLREKRSPAVLCNTSFVSWLRASEGAM